MSNIEKYKGGELLPALSQDPRSVIEALKENLGNVSINESYLTKIKMPSGGATFFEIPSLDGPTPEKELICTIVFHRSGRAYFSKPFDEAPDDAKFPDCTSEDGLIGIGTPGGNCVECGLSKFGSARGRDGNPAKGQACSQRQTLYIMRGTQMMPEIVSIPASSLKPAQDFLFKLATSGVKYYNALVSISLRKDSNANNIAYSECEFRFLRKLTPEESANAEMWNKMIRVVAENAAEGRKRMAIEGRS